jgi:hypothetical protein
MKNRPEAPATETPEHKTMILLRNVPPTILQAINRKKTDILTNNPFRTTVSDSEAVFKLILKGGSKE